MNNEQNLINDVVRFISNTSEPNSVTNEMVGRVLSFLIGKYEGLANNLDLEATTRAADDEGLETQISKCLCAWHGTQAQYNAFETKDANKVYIINDTLDTDKVVAVYLGTQLLWYEPNMVGEFTADSTKEDWYWWPNGVKTAIPVDPSTCKFSYYWPDTLTTAQRLFSYNIAAGLESEVKFSKHKLKRLERMPIIGNANTYYLFSALGNLEVLPVLDFRGRTTQYVGYVCLPGGNNKPKWKRIAFANTSGITDWEMILNGHLEDCLILTGLDLSSTKRFVSAPLAINGMPYVEIINLGKAQAATSFDLKNNNWGDETMLNGARQSLVDSLLTNSFDRATAGYAACTLQLSAEAYARLTSAEVAAITAKGFTLVTA